MGAQEQAAYVQTYQQQTEQIRQQVLTTLVAMYAGYKSFRGDQAEAFAAAAVPIVASGQETIAQLAEAYLGLMLADMLGQAVDKLPVPSLLDTVTYGLLVAERGLRGTPPAEVYQRPFKTVWYELSQKNSFDWSVDQGQKRLESIAATDLQLAKTHTFRDLMSETAQIVGYRRVLEGSYSCGLCVLASTQRYHKSQLMPIHPACDCSVAPIIGEQDPGQVIDDTGAEDLHYAVQDRFGESAPAGRGAVDYKDFVVTHDHGEIGPVLSRKGDHFDGPEEVAA